jgi:hypothetical protein
MTWTLPENSSAARRAESVPDSLEDVHETTSEAIIGTRV